jgi:hypothetical protein
VTRQEKLIERLKGRPRDFRWEELVRLLASLGYSEVARGKTGGSRRRFIHATGPTLSFHKPHPGNIVRAYVVDELLRILTEERLI